MATQMIQFGYDTDAVWSRVRGRTSVFLDSNCWIDMADGKKETPSRVRERLRALVASGRVFCPLSWGVLEELFDQSGPSLPRTASLMEELSLNAIFRMRTELYEWELARSMRRLMCEPIDEGLDGLFVPPGAFVGSGPSVALNFPDGVSFSAEVVADAQAYMKKHLSAIGVVELAGTMGGRTMDRTPPAYSEAAKKAKEVCNGNKTKVFMEEAGNCFRMYITPQLLRKYPQTMEVWLAQFGRGDDEAAWFRKALAELPALYNYTEVMAVASSQPERKDKYNHFMDNEIIVAPLAYADVFVTADKGVKDIVRNRTKILTRSKCQFCDSLDALETMLPALGL